MSLTICGQTYDRRMMVRRTMSGVKPGLRTVWAVRPNAAASLDTIGVRSHGRHNGSRPQTCSARLLAGGDCLASPSTCVHRETDSLRFGRLSNRHTYLAIANIAHDCEPHLRSRTANNTVKRSRETHSFLSTTTGSRREARNAGTAAATIAIPISDTATKKNIATLLACIL